MRWLRRRKAERKRTDLGFDLRRAGLSVAAVNVISQWDLLPSSSTATMP